MAGEAVEASGGSVQGDFPRAPAAVDAATKHMRRARYADLMAKGAGELVEKSYMSVGKVADGIGGALSAVNGYFERHPWQRGIITSVLGTAGTIAATEYVRRKNPNLKFKLPLR